MSLLLLEEVLRNCSTRLMPWSTTDRPPCRLQHSTLLWHRAHPHPTPTLTHLCEGKGSRSLCTSFRAAAVASFSPCSLRVSDVAWLLCRHAPNPTSRRNSKKHLCTNCLS